MYCGFTLCYLNVHFSWKFVNHLHYSILKQTYLVVTNLGLFISPYFFVYLYNVSLWVKILFCFLNPQNLIHLIVVVQWRSRYKQFVASYDVDCTLFPELKSEPFYFISFQCLCKTDYDEYLPAEIAIIEYSIEKGITKNLHRFIEPGRLSW